MNYIEDIKGKHKLDMEEQQSQALKHALMHRYDIRGSDAKELMSEIDKMARKYEEKPCA
jgi:hypothetical protein